MISHNDTRAEGLRDSFYERSGHLTDAKRLRGPVLALVIRDDNEIIISEPRFHIHGYGVSFTEAERDFRSVLADTYELLEEDEDSLDPYLASQLAFLRSIIQSSV